MVWCRQYLVFGEVVLHDVTPVLLLCAVLGSDGSVEV